MTGSSNAAVELLAGTPPGGGQDRAARAFAGALGTSAAVTNMPGRGGANAWDALLRRFGDPTVASISSPTIITNRELGIADHDDRDFTVLSQLCVEYLAFFVDAARGPQSPDTLLERLADGRVAVAIATERGNVNHIALSMVARTAGIAEVPVRVFTSARHAIADVIAGDAACAVVSAASTLPELEAGSGRVVVTTSPERMASPFDAIPTWRERGVDCTMGTWRGLVGPPGLSPEAIAAWETSIASAVTGEAWQESVRRHRWVGAPPGRDFALAFLDEQRVTLVGGLRDLGLTTDV